MPVPNTMSDLSNVAGDNYPVGSEPIGNNLDNYLRAHASLIRQSNALASSSMPSGSTVNIANANGESVNITGSSAINSFGSGFPGCVRELRFSGSATLVHSTSLRLPGNSNIITANGHIHIFRCLGGGTWAYVAGTPAPGLSQKAGLAEANIFTDTQTIRGASNSNRMLSFENSAQQVVAQVLGNGTGGITIGAGGFVHLRPNGVGSSSGEVRLNANGDLTVSGMITANGYAVWTNGTFSPEEKANLSGGNIFKGGQTFKGVSNADRSLQFESDISEVARITPHTAGGLSLGGNGYVNINPNGGTSSANRFSFPSSGAATGTDWVATSDRRLKTDIERVGARQALLEVLGYYRFKWKLDGRDGIGVIAQEVLKVAPELVEKSEDGILHVNKAGLALEMCFALIDRLGAH